MDLFSLDHQFVANLQKMNPSFDLKKKNNEKNEEAQCAIENQKRFCVGEATTY